MAREITISYNVKVCGYSNKTSSCKHRVDEGADYCKMHINPCSYTGCTKRSRNQTCALHNPERMEKARVTARAAWVKQKEARRLAQEEWDAEQERIKQDELKMGAAIVDGWAESTARKAAAEKAKAIEDKKERKAAGYKRGFDSMDYATACKAMCGHDWWVWMGEFGDEVRFEKVTKRVAEEAREAERINAAEELKYAGLTQQERESLESMLHMTKLVTNWEKTYKIPYDLYPVVDLNTDNLVERRRKYLPNYLKLRAEIEAGNLEVRC